MRQQRGRTRSGARGPHYMDSFAFANRPRISGGRKATPHRGGAADSRQAFPLPVASTGPAVCAACGIGHGDVCQADRLGRAAAARPRDPGHGDRQICSRPSQRAEGHGSSHLGADGAVGGQLLRRHPEETLLGFVGVGDDPAVEVAA